MNVDQQIVEWLNQNRLKQLDPFFIFITDTASFIAYLIPLLLVVYGFYKRSDYLKFLAVQILCAILLSTLLVTVIKNLIRRQRPFIMDHLIHKLSVGGGYSFPSGHTADAVVTAVSVTLVIYARKWLLAPLWLWACLVAYSRMLLGVHYPTDLAGAAVIASFCAILIFFLFKKKRDQLFKKQQFLL